MTTWRAPLSALMAAFATSPRSTRICRSELVIPRRWRSPPSDAKGVQRTQAGNAGRPGRRRDPRSAVSANTFGDAPRPEPRTRTKQTPAPEPRASPQPRTRLRRRADLRRQERERAWVRGPICPQDERSVSVPAQRALTHDLVRISPPPRRPQRRRPARRSQPRSERKPVLQSSYAFPPRSHAPTVGQHERRQLHHATRLGAPCARISAHAALRQLLAPESPLDMTRPPSPLLFGM